MGRRRVLITGAAGRVGAYLGRHMQNLYDLRLADIRPLDYEVGPSHERLELDITKLDQMQRACRDMDTIVHLAANPSPSATFYGSLLEPNVIGMFNAFQAAADQKCRRMVFASSLVAVLGYDPQVAVTADMAANPPYVYGACKAFGEALACAFHHQFGLSTVSIRFGAVRDEPPPGDPSEQTIWITKADATHLVACCIEAEGIDFAIVHGLSDHRVCNFDISQTGELVGYRPRDGTARDAGTPSG